jgi:trehalose-6-phosphatase
MRNLMWHYRRAVDLENAAEELAIRIDVISG